MLQKCLIFLETLARNGSANQWAGFYMITAPIMKELKELNRRYFIRKGE